MAQENLIQVISILLQKY